MSDTDGATGAVPDPSAVEPADLSKTASSAHPSPPSTPEHRSFLEKELDHLRSQIRSDLAEARALERYVLAAAGAAIAWIATHQSSSLPKAVYWIPCGIALFGLLRASWARKHVREAAAYIRRTEMALHPTEGGWEMYLEFPPEAPKSVSEKAGPSQTGRGGADASSSEAPNTGNIQASGDAAADPTPTPTRLATRRAFQTRSKKPRRRWSLPATAFWLGLVVCTFYLGCILYLGAGPGRP
jgi:hypothetical protein